jgi:hypothetical protein
MTAKDQNFTMNEGETKKLDIDETIDEDNGGTLNIGGYNSLIWQLHPYRGGDVLVEKDTSDGITVTDSSVGAYEVTIDSADTDGLLYDDSATFYHHVRLTDGSGNTSDLLEGTVTINAD